MKPDKAKYQQNLLSYLRYNGIDIQRDNQLRCPNHSAHSNNDNNFSAHYYSRSAKGKPQIKCFACGWVGDIYDLCGLINGENDFIEQYKIIDKVFGICKFSEMPENYVASGGKSGSDIEPVKFVAVPRDRAGHIFRKEQIDNCRSYSKHDIVRNGEIKGHWFYDDCNGRIIAIDVRFELATENGIKKTVQTFWYDGRRVCSYGKINIIYNLYEALNCNRPIIIHEGAKCAKIGKSALTNFCNVSYNRGVQNADKPEWKVLSRPDEITYILPDNDEVGYDAALKIWKNFDNVVILCGIYKHFGIAHIKGADIEDLLFSGADIGSIEDYILNGEYKNG